MIDPGFYDWGDTDDSGYGQGSAADNSTAPYPDQSAAYPDQSYPAPAEPPQARYADEMPPGSAPSESPQAGSAPVAAPESLQALTVIFKGGRAPAKIQNYMMTATALTDLDHHKFEQIPLDEIDVAATRQANLANGIDFKIPGA